MDEATDACGMNVSRRKHWRFRIMKGSRTGGFAELPTKPVPISGTVLKWAIRESGLTEHSIAALLEVPVSLVQEWATGTALPTKTQFDDIVRILRRPSAIFFLPEPPEERPVRPILFRRSAKNEQARLTPDEARWIRETSRLQEAASIIARQLKKDAIDLPTISLKANYEDMAEKERNRVGVSIRFQTSWKDDYEALKTWRRALEDRGIAVMLLRLGGSSCRGFSLWNDWVPLVAANTHYRPTARIYTLFHEYAHLLTRTDAVCADFTGPGHHDPDGTERWCEKFAAAFLLPRDSLHDYLRSFWSGNSVTEFQIVSRIANHFKVSLRATALRLVELRLADNSLYEDVDKKARYDETRRRGGGGAGLRRPQIRVEEYGGHIPSIFLQGLHRKLIDTYDILDYLDLGTRDLDELEQMLVR